MNGMNVLYSDAAWVRELARVPQRQLQILLAGSLILLAILLWLLVLRLPVRQLHLLRGERSVLETSAMDVTIQHRQQLVDHNNLELSHQLGALGAQHTSDGILVDLIGTIDRVGRQHGIVLAGATPGPVRSSVIFDEVPFDIEAHGSYQGLVDWMTEIERILPTLSIVRFSIQPSPVAEASGQLNIKLRVAAYRIQGGH